MTGTEVLPGFAYCLRLFPLLMLATLAVRPSRSCGTPEVRRRCSQLRFGCCRREQFE